MSLTPVPQGHLAAVVTYLEMLEPPQAAPLPESPLALVARPDSSPEQYRNLFRKVGAPWLWFSRLAMDDARLSSAIGELYAIVDAAGVEVGMIELDFSVPGECELAFIGLVPELAGKGHGRWLLAEALRLAWRDSIRRVHVHTCTLDHPAALAAYRRAGFAPIKRAIETFPDPRLSGFLPPDSAPHWPLV
ncbi:MAG TPA: GNAT family N-acetyltransferase [Sphingomicrobium sp.]|nr:GNAT family N-acetyltransferase [Sphingomicrobium sp.]